MTGHHWWPFAWDVVPGLVLGLAVGLGAESGGALALLFLLLGVYPLASGSIPHLAPLSLSEAFAGRLLGRAGLLLAVPVASLVASRAGTDPVEAAALAGVGVMWVAHGLIREEVSAVERLATPGHSTPYMLGPVVPALLVVSDSPWVRFFCLPAILSTALALHVRSAQQVGSRPTRTDVVVGPGSTLRFAAMWAWVVGLAGITGSAWLHGLGAPTLASRVVEWLAVVALVSMPRSVVDTPWVRGWSALPEPVEALFLPRDAIEDALASMLASGLAASMVAVVFTVGQSLRGPIDPAMTLAVTATAGLFAVSSLRLGAFSTKWTLPIVVVGLYVVSAEWPDNPLARGALWVGPLLAGVAAAFVWSRMLFPRSFPKRWR
jgi:hypothetical protein